LKPPIRSLFGCAVLLLGAAAGGARAPGKIGRTPILFLGATLIDGSGAGPVPNAYILVRNGRIAEIGAASGPPGGAAPRGARVVDVSGKWILPGFVDSHVHVESRRDPVAMIRWGVTAARLMAEDSAKAHRVATRSRSRVHSPDFYPAAPIFTARGGWWSEQPPDAHLDRFPADPESARLSVDRARQLGSDEIKIMDDDMGWCRDPLPRLRQIDAGVLTALAGEARRLGMRVSVHAPLLEQARQAVAARATVLAHGILDREIDEETMREMKRADVSYVPTLDVFDFLASPRDFMARALSDRRIAGSLRPETLARYRSEAYFKSYLRKYPNAAFVAGHRKILDGNVRRLKEAGVRVALGTDMWALPGAAVHLELEDLVRAGLSPLEALRAATLASAESLGEESRRGTLAPGKIADLIVLENDPLADISNTRSIESVYKHGRLAWSRFRPGLVQ
jgi:imidazolonepropionase-like amidohydrolase